MENYEQKYNAALERAKEMCAMPTDKATMEYIFPELKESEGEQSRKWILEYLYDGLRKSDEQFKGQFKTAIAWLEKQGNKSVNIDIESIISSYKQRLKSQGSIENTPLFDICLTAFRHGVENVLEELNLKALDPDKVIEWLKTKVYDDSAYGIAMIDKFKKDFGL